MTGDVGRDLHWHFIVTEYAHTRLCACGTRSPPRRRRWPRAWGPDVAGRWVAAFARRHPPPGARPLGDLVAVTLALAVAAAGVRLDNNFAALFATSSAEARFRGGLPGHLRPRRQPPRHGTDLRRRPVAAGQRRRRPPAWSTGCPGSGGGRRGGPGRQPDGHRGARARHRAPDPAFGPGPGFGALPFADRGDARPPGGGWAQFLVSDDGRTWLVVSELEAARDSYEEVVGPTAAVEQAARAAVDRGGLPAGSVDVEFAGVASPRSRQSTGCRATCWPCRRSPPW